MEKVKSYEEFLIENVFEQVKNEKELKKSAKQIVDKHYTERLSDGSNFRSFQKYYFEHLGNITDFSKFKAAYSLQGNSKSDLEYLDSNKEKIKSLIVQGKLPEVYFSFFDNMNDSKKSYGSFFTKVVHAYRPKEYSPIDTPMKVGYFDNLKNESYFTSMVVISAAFRKWADENRAKMEEMKKLLVAATPKEFGATVEKTTDIKVMNVIFWSIANLPK